MCGIISCLVFKQSKFGVSEEYIFSARDSITKRGPDGGDLWILLKKVVLRLTFVTVLINLLFREN